MFKRMRSVAAGIALSAVILAPAQVLADMADDEAAIQEIWSTYTAARVAGDAEAWLGLWDTNGIRMPPGVPAVDFATFAPGTPERFADAPDSMEIMAEEIVVAGDWAYSRGTFTVNNAVEGKFLTIFRRQDDGSWRIYRDAFNFNSE
jgi:ketosteroid isomerase-like protein